MANTYTSLHYHIVLSTKNREPWLTPAKETRIWEYIGGIARTNGMKALKVGGYDDHVYILLALPATHCLKAASYYHFDLWDDWYFEIRKGRQKPQEPEVGVRYPRVVKTIGPNPSQYGYFDE
jgi:hypothetical protein